MPRTALPTSTVSRGAALAAAGLTTWRARGGDEAARDAARSHVAARLGRLRGMPQKMGQMLSLSDGDDGDLAALRERGEPMPLDDLRPALEAAWGVSIESVCAEIEPEGRAASIGQVHRARLHDGRDVAIKVQYPGIADAIEADLRLLGWISEPMGGLRRGFDLESYRRTVRTALAEELDYRGEAERQRRFARTFAGAPVIVPAVIAEWSSATVLMTEWEDGATLDEARGWSDENRHEAAKALLAVFVHGVFDHGLVHADPHPGNFRFRADPTGVSVVLYDYGSVHAIAPERRLALLRLVGDTFDRDATGDPWPVFLALGFDRTLLEPLRDRLPALCRILLEPFGSPMKFDLAGWNRAERIGDVLGEDRWNFRVAGPADLLLLIRAFQGLIHNLAALDVPVSWSRWLRPLLARDADAVRRLALPDAVDAARGFGGLARHLVIRVTHDGATKAKVSLPAEAVDCLEAVIDAPILERISERGIDLDAVARAARRRSYTPQELFELDDRDRSIRVWLE